MHPSLTKRAAKAASWTLSNGAKVPNIGFGTWKMNREQASASVSHALKTGYRHLDCAWAYRNEDGVGEAIRKSGIKRDQLFVTSKLWNTFHGDNVEAGLDATLKDLGLDHLDLYLMHWPVAFANPNSSQISSLKSQTGRPVEEVNLSNDLALTWSRMEEMVKKGKIRNIGISNFNIRRTEELLKHATIAPVINQVEVNWGVANEELLHYSEAHQIMLQAYSPLGGSNNVNEYLENPVVQDVAQRNHMTPAQVLLAWPLARGIIPIVKSNTPERVEQNLATANLKLPWDDVVHLTRESQVGGIERSVDPTEAWATASDIFEDGKDQERLLGLKDTTLHVPPAHEASGHHFLEPRNDPAAPVLGPGGIPVRSFHSLAHLGSASRIARPTAVQVVLKRHFSSTLRPRYAATAEAQPPSTSEAPAVSASPLLAHSAKAALGTPGLTFTDGEQGVARETRKMNLYTVRGAAVGFGCASRSFSSCAKTSAGSLFSPRVASARQGRVYAPRKAFLYAQYEGMVQQSDLLLVLSHAFLSVASLARIRAELQAATGSGVVRMTTVRSGLLRPLLRKQTDAASQSLEKLLKGPIMLLSCQTLEPKVLTTVLNVLEKHASPDDKNPKAPRITPLAGLVQGRALDVATLRAVGKLPNLQTLRAQLVGLLSAPAAQLSAVLGQAAGGDVAATLEARRRALEEEQNS